MSPTRGSQKRPKVVEGWRYGSGRAFQGKVEVWFFDDNRSSKVSAGVLQPSCGGTVLRRRRSGMSASVPFGKYVSTGRWCFRSCRAATGSAGRRSRRPGPAQPCVEPMSETGGVARAGSDRIDGFGTVSSQRWTVLGGLAVFVKAGEVQRREPGGPLDQRSDCPAPRSGRSARERRGRLPRPAAR